MLPICHERSEAIWAVVIAAIWADDSAARASVLSPGIARLLSNAISSVEKAADLVAGLRRALDEI